MVFLSHREILETEECAMSEMHWRWKTLMAVWPLQPCSNGQGGVRRIYNSAHVCQYGVHGHCMKDDTHKPRQCKHLETSSIFM